MDLDEWEVIPSIKPGNFYSISNYKEPPSFIGPTLFFETDYFKCPSDTQQHHQQEKEEEEENHEDEDEEEEEEKPTEEEALASIEFKDIGINTEFEISKETKAPTTPFNWLEPDPEVFDRSITEKYEKEDDNSMPMQMGRNKEMVEDDKDFAGFNIWGLAIHGIGAICSFGVATVATLCVFALGTASASNTGRLRPSPNIQFQICSHDKRIKEVVQRATGLNHAISATRGITIPRAQITFGGHYESV